MTWSLLRVAAQSQGKYVEYVNEFLPWIELYYPRYERLVRPHGQGRAIKVLRPVYPGYIFVRRGRASTLELCSLPVRASWVRFAGNIGTVHDRVIEVIQEFEGRNELVREIRYVNPYRRGVSVRIHLPMGDIIGIVVKGIGNKIVVDSALCRCTVPRHLLEVV